MPVRTAPGLPLRLAAHIQVAELPEVKGLVAGLQRRIGELERRIKTLELERDEWERQYDALLASVRKAGVA